MTTSTIASEAYLADLLRYYEEEIQGEGLFQRIADASPDPVIKAKWLEFAALEVHTRRAMEPLIRQYELQPQSREAMLKIGIDEADAEWLKMSWTEAMTFIVEDFPRFIKEFVDLIEIGPLVDQTCLEQILNHEEAMIAYAKLELAGDTAASANVFPNHFRKWS